MNPNDNDEERLIRIEHMLEQLQKDAIKHVAAKVIEAVIEATPSLVSAAPTPAPPPATARKN
jgi:hypothetical protein